MRLQIHEDEVGKGVSRFTGEQQTKQRLILEYRAERRKLRHLLLGDAPTAEQRWRPGHFAVRLPKWVILAKPESGTPDK